MQNLPSVKIKRLHADAILPQYDHAGDAGLALHTIEARSLMPGERYAFDVGWSMELPQGFVGLIMDRSGLALKNGIKTIGGVCDAGYRGSYKVILINLSQQKYSVEKGDKIAQLLIMPVQAATVEEVDVLSETDRGSGGFGSTGR